ncbi:LTA synthase family protein [Flavitalea flava]
MLTSTGIKIPKLIRSIFATGIIFLLIMSLLRLALFFSFSNQANGFSDLLPSFLLGIRFDLRYICIFLALLLLLGCFRPLNPFRSSTGKKITLFLIGLATFLIVFFYSVDFANYSYLSQRLNAGVLNYLIDVRISANMVWQTYPVIRILLVLILGTIFIFLLIKAIYKGILKSKKSDLSDRGRIAWIVVAFLLLGLAIFGRVGQYPLRWSDAFGLGSDYKANLALNPFQSFFSSLKFRHSVYNEEKIIAAIPVLSPYFGFTETKVPGVAEIAPRRDSLEKAFIRDIAPRPGTLTSRPNVIVVICESFSGYKSSMWGNPLNTTPFFNGLCKKGIFFDHCFTPSYGTARGVWAVVTGIPDIEVATTTSSRNPAAVDQHTIINDFTGYEKFYFLGGSTSWANIRGLLTNNIKDLRLYEQENYSAPKVDVWGISDKNLFLEANKVLKQQTAPFFAVIQTADNHRPYTIPAEDQQAFHSIEVPKDSLRKSGFENNEEMNAFRYTDFGYQTFIEAAGKEKYFDNTVFLFIGDHGIPGDAGTMFPRAWTDQRLTAEHVPLLIYAPKLLPDSRITHPCSQVDVLPTLAGLCNIPYRNTALGRDLLDTASYNGKALSFIYDPDQGVIGVVKDDYYYRKQLKTGKEEMVSIINNDPVPATILNGPQKMKMQQLTDGIYETAKFMVLKNKKK